MKPYYIFITLTHLSFMSKDRCVFLCRALFPHPRAHPTWPSVIFACRKQRGFHIIAPWMRFIVSARWCGRKRQRAATAFLSRYISSNSLVVRRTGWIVLSKFCVCVMSPVCIWKRQNRYECRHLRPLQTTNVKKASKVSSGSAKAKTGLCEKNDSQAFERRFGS